LHFFQMTDWIDLIFGFAWKQTCDVARRLGV
jgi:hypothetical protein